MKSKTAIIGLCGFSGCGKTRTCQKLITELRSNGIKCGGFISPAIFEGKEKTGIKVQWLENDEERILMTLAIQASQQTFGKWQIRTDAFSWIDQRLNGICECQVFFCDEIGPLEVLQGKGWVKALEILNERKFELNVVTFRPSLRDYFEQRFPDMTIYDLIQQGTDEVVISDCRTFFGIG